MRPLSADDVLRLPVRHNGIDLGRSLDLAIDLDAGRVLGLEVRCRDDAHRFLPLPAARLTSDEVDVESPLTLLDDLAFYRRRGSSYRELRGGTVEQAGRAVGTLKDVELGLEGAFTLVVTTPTGDVRLAGAAGVRIRPAGPRATAA